MCKLPDYSQSKKLTPAFSVQSLHWGLATDRPLG